MSTSHKATRDVVLGLIRDIDAGITGPILDLGAGRGSMCRLVGDLLSAKGRAVSGNLFACDLYPESFACEGVTCERANANGRLPYDDGRFSVVYSVEVMEHIHNPLMFLEEIHRILSPGAVAILTTPNVLNLNSRVNYLVNGFYALFDPLSFDTRSERSTSGHVMPLNCYYWSYLMKKAGFKSIDIHPDRIKRSGLIYYLLFFPLIKAGTGYILRKSQRGGMKRYEDNREMLVKINSLELLCSRSCVFFCRK